MRAALPLQDRSTALARDKALPPLDADWLSATHSPAERRPPSIRDAIIRWLNEEL